MKDATERIEDVEVKVAFLEAHLLELSDVVRGLADQVGSLEGELRLLREQVQADEEAGTGVEKPPHY